MISKKNLSVLLLSVSLLLTGCGNSSGNTSSTGTSSGQEQSETTHHWDTNWSKDETHHWHKCTDAGCNEVKDKAEHTFGQPVVITPATCTSDGEQKLVCSVCQYEKREVIHALGHEKDETKWSSDATHHWHACKHEGCEEAWDKAEHTFGEWYVIRESSWTSYGQEGRKCSVCEYVEKRDLTTLREVNDQWAIDATDPANHKYTNKIAAAYGSIPLSAPTGDTFVYSADVTLNVAEVKACLCFKGNFGQEVATGIDLEGVEYYAIYLNSKTFATSIAHVFLEGSTAWHQTSVVTIPSAAGVDQALKDKVNAYLNGADGASNTFRMTVVSDGNNILYYMDGHFVSSATYDNATLKPAIAAGTKLGMRTEIKAEGATFSNFAASNDISDFKYVATYNGGAHGTPAKASDAVYRGDSVTLPDVTPETGYTFVGWAETEGGEVVYNAGDVVKLTASKTFYAICTNNAVLAYSTGKVKNVKNVPAAASKPDGYALTAADLPELSKAGYVFDGWYIGDVKATVGTTISGGVTTTLTAKWSRDELSTKNYTYATYNTPQPAAKGVVYNDDVYTVLEKSASAVETSNLVFSTGYIEFFYDYRTTPKECGFGLCVRASGLDGCASGNGTGTGKFWEQFGGLFIQVPSLSTTKFMVYGPVSAAVGAIENTEMKFVSGTTYLIGVQLSEKIESDVLVGFIVEVYVNGALFGTFDTTTRAHASWVTATGTQVGWRSNAPASLPATDDGTYAGSVYGLRVVTDK